MIRPITRIVATLSAFLLTTALSADVVVTELSTKGAQNPEDYFELTNTGAAAADISGWQFDDESASIGDAVPLNGITTIAPNESVIFFQLDETDPMDPAYDPAGEMALFRSFWGGLAGVQVGWHAGAGLGKGDAINLFDSADALVLTLEYGMTLPEQTHAGDWAAGNTDGSDTYENEAAIWVPGTDPQQWVLAEAGVYGAVANVDGEYGSPGFVVPEPSMSLLTVLAAVGIAVARRK